MSSTIKISTSTLDTALSSSPSSPLVLRLHKQPIGMTKAFNDDTASTSSSYRLPTLSKRNRPARLDIPVRNTGFRCGSPVSPAVVVDPMEVEGEGYSVYCKKGRRQAMEDRYSIVVNLHGDSKQALFGVFDGHGGAKAADFAAENLATNILDEVEVKDEKEIEEAVKSGYLLTDSDFLEEDLRGGSCCVTAPIKNGNLVVSNAGDCRAVLSRGGLAEALTSDHRPSRKDEKHRIETLGGYVDCCRGVWRIRSLAVSRGIGDRTLKQWVTAEPETRILRLESETEFLILASDGLWDKVSNQEAVDIARPLCIGIQNPEPLAAVKSLQHSLFHGARLTTLA